MAELGIESPMDYFRHPLQLINVRRGRRKDMVEAGADDGKNERPNDATPHVGRIPAPPRRIVHPLLFDDGVCLQSLAQDGSAFLV